MDEFMKTLIRLSAEKGTGKITLDIDPEKLAQTELEAIADNCICSQRDMDEFDRHADNIMLLIDLLMTRIRHAQE